MSRRGDVPCAHCAGTGWVRLSPVYRETLALLKIQSAPVNGRQLADQAGCAGEAMCNRLRRLESYGLARGVKQGREVLWTFTP
jgi:hypothetical protein